MSDLADSAYKAEQISVFLENRAGRLAEVISLLASAGLNIRALSLADTSDFGILRMVTSDNNHADKILKDHGFTTGRTNVIAIELEDKPGALDALLQLLGKNDVNVEYMYAYARRDAKKAVMIFRFDRLDSAIPLVRSAGFAILTGTELTTI